MSTSADDSALPSWKALRFEASKLFIKAEMEVRLQPTTPTSGDTLLDSPSGRPLQGSAANSPLWSVELTSVAAGRRSRSRVVFDPTTQAALQRTKEKLGSKPYDKVSRFTHDGVYTRRRAPTDDSEKGRPASTWTKIETKFEPYPGWQPADTATGRPEHPSPVLGGTAADGSRACGAILEPSQLLYLLATLDLDHPPTDLCIFASGSISRLLFEPRGTTAVTVDIEESTGQSSRRHSGKVNARCVVVRSQSLDGQPGSELELLGLEGDVEIFLDTTRGYPIEVRGKLPHLGSVRVALVGVDRG